MQMLREKNCWMTREKDKKGADPEQAHADVQEQEPLT